MQERSLRSLFQVKLSLFSVVILFDQDILTWDIFSVDQATEQ